MDLGTACVLRAGRKHKGRPMVWETCKVCEEGSHNQLTYFINFHSIYILTCLDTCCPLTHPTPSHPHHHFLPCMQEQARGEHSWPAPPSRGMGYLWQVPVEQPWLVSAATVMLVSTHLLTRGSGRLEGVGKEDGYEGQHSGGLEAKEAHAISQQMDTGLNNFQSLPFPSGCGLDPSSHNHLLLALADVNSPSFTLACH